MEGNDDTNYDTGNQVLLNPSIIARYLRFTPLTYYKWPVMRIEATGTSFTRVAGIFKIQICK